MQMSTEIERLQQELRLRDRQLSELAGKCQRLERSNSKLQGETRAEDFVCARKSVQQMKADVESLHHKLSDQQASITA